MKKLYILAIALVSTLSFAQTTHLNDAFNYADNTLLTANGWTAHSGAGTQAIDVGASNGLTYAGYNDGVSSITGATAGNAAKVDNNGEDVNKVFTNPVTTGNTVYLSFLLNVANASTGYFMHLSPTATGTQVARVFVRPSAITPVTKFNIGISNTATAVYGASELDLNVTYLVIVKYDNTTTGAVSLWITSSGIPASEGAAGAAEASASGTGSAAIDRICLRQFIATQNETIDGIFLSSSWLGTTPCALSLGAETATCNAITLAIDTYNVTIPYTGGGSGSYTLSSNAGTIGGNNPSSVAAGNITITNIPEGTNLNFTVTGSCSLSKTVIAPNCKPTNTLPYSESFSYTIGNSLGNEQKWTNANTGDDVVIASGSLTYTGVTPAGNSASFDGAGIEARTPFTSTTSGTLYSSFLFSVPAAGYDGVADMISTYFALFTDNTGGSTNARVWIRKNGTQYQFGLSTTAVAADVVWSTNLYNVGTTQYLVLGYDFTANTLVLFENQATPSVPSASVTPGTPFSNLGGFMLRQDTAVTTPFVLFDELKINTTLPTLSRSNFDAIDGLSMYPNPLSGKVLNITSNANNDMSVAIYDLLGKEVLTSKVVNNTVAVATLTSGLYIVKITEGDKTATRKLVIE